MHFMIHEVRVDTSVPNIIFLRHFRKLVDTNLFHTNRMAYEQYGIWNRVRVDKGREFYLLLFIQERLSAYRKCTEKAPYRQTGSKEVKKRVTFTANNY